MRRLAIYAFYDPDGLVDDYVVDCVRAIAEHCERTLVVSNGPVASGSADRLTAVPSVELFERDNEGFDIWGYKHGLESVGWDELERYDEVVLMNSTIAGPLYPLSEMFDAMDARRADFWGLTAHAGEDYDPWDLLPTDKLERHIQSYFTVIRQPMLSRPEFRGYWDSLPMIRSYTEAVALHEAVFTQKFEELGFHWTSYVDGADLEAISPYPLMFLPEQVLVTKRCPFFKRKALLLGASDLAATHAMSTAAMVGCLSRLGYDLDRVLPNVIRTSHQSDVRLSLSTFAMLEPASGDHTTNLSRVRVVARVKDIESCLALERFRSVLERCGHFVIVADHHLDERVLRRLTAFKARLVTNAGVSEFASEVGHGAQTKDHLLLFGCTGGEAGLSAYSRYEAGLRALADSEGVLASAVAHLEGSRLAGALASPLTSIGIDSWSVDWREAGAPLDTVLPLLGLDVPLNRAKAAWGPFGGIVLAAPGMLAADWDVVADTMSGLPRSRAEELFASLIPFILQGHGRLLEFSLPERMTASAVFASHLRQALRCAVAAEAKQSRRSARVYHNAGAGYLEDEAVSVRPRPSPDGRVTFSWQAPAAVESVRFDPVEGAGVVCRGAAVTVNGVAAEIVPVNCMRFGGALDVFMTTDPIYDVRGVTPGANVIVTLDSIEYIDGSDFAAPPPSGDDLEAYGGPLTPALLTIQAELTAMRDAHNAMREAHDALVEVRVRRRARALIAKLRARTSRRAA